MQLRRQNRLRREYLYKKEQQAKDAATVNRKQAGRDATDAAIRAAKGKGKEIPQGRLLIVHPHYSVMCMAF